MKLASYRNLRFGFVTLLILSGVTWLSAQSSDRPRGNAIIFSGPKSDTVSSNLNDLRIPASPFRDMESSLKKPFELFEPGKPGPSSLPILKHTPAPQPQLKQKPMKDILNERAEAMFLEPGLHEGETDDDLFKSTEESYDSYTRKPKNSLDRYYDRVDRAMTNRTSAAEPFEGSPDLRDSSNPNSANPFAERPVQDAWRNPADNRFRSPSTSSDFRRNGLFGDRPDATVPNRPESYYPSYREQKVDRLDAFKQLLEGSGGSRATTPSRNRNYTTTPARSPSPTPATTGFNTRPAGSVAPADTFTKSAGLIGSPGKPQGLPDYAAPSSGVHTEATKQPAKPPAPPTFNVPQRRF